MLSVPFPFICPYWYLCIRLLSRWAWTLFKLCDSLKSKTSAWATQNTRHICWIITFWAQLCELALGYCKAWHLIMNNGNRKSCLDDTSVAEIHKYTHRFISVVSQKVNREKNARYRTVFQSGNSTHIILLKCISFLHSRKPASKLGLLTQVKMSDHKKQATM